MVPTAASVFKECLFRMLGGRRGTELGIRPSVLKTIKLDLQHMQEEFLMKLCVLHELPKSMFCNIPVVLDKNECH